MRIEQSVYDKVLLPEIVEINVGKTPARKDPTNFGGEYPWIAISDMGKGKYISRTKENLSEKGIITSNIKPVAPNTLLFSFKLSIGKVAITTKEMYTNEAIAAFPIKDSNRIDLSYFYYVMSSFDFADGGARAVMGKTLNKAKLKKLKIPLPPLPIQRRIAAILDQADALRRKDAELLARYDALAQSVFLEMFGDLKGEPVPLSTLCKVNPRKSEIKDYDKSTLVSFVPMANVSEQGDLTLEEEKPIEEVWSGYTYFREDDTVFAKITPCMENGKGALMRGLKNGLGFGTTEFHVLRPVSGKSIPEWLYYLTASTKFREIASVNMTGSAGQKRVPTSFFDKFKLVPPSVELQKAFAERIRLIERQIVLVKENQIKSEALFQALLQKAFK